MKSEVPLPNFFVAIMHVNQEPWLSIVRDGQSQFWEREKYEKIEVVYFHSVLNKFYSKLNKRIEHLRWDSGSKFSYLISYILMISLIPWRNSVPKFRKSSASESGVTSHSILVNCPEMISTIRWKKIAILEYFLKSSQAEFLIITNSSSILNIYPIADFVIKHCKNDYPFYAGPIHTGYDGEFVSGSFTIMNRCSAEILFKKLHLIPLHVMDDIGFGTAFNKLGVIPVNYDSLLISSNEELEKLTNEEIRLAGHFRLKSGTLQKRNDVELATKLLKRMENL